MTFVSAISSRTRQGKAPSAVVRLPGLVGNDDPNPAKTGASTR